MGIDVPGVVIADTIHPETDDGIVIQVKIGPIDAIGIRRAALAVECRQGKADAGRGNDEQGGGNGEVETRNIGSAHRIQCARVS